MSGQVSWGPYQSFRYCRLSRLCPPLMCRGILWTRIRSHLHWQGVRHLASYVSFLFSPLFPLYSWTSSWPTVEGYGWFCGPRKASLDIKFAATFEEIPSVVHLMKWPHSQEAKGYQERYCQLLPSKFQCQGPGTRRLRVSYLNIDWLDFRLTIGGRS